MTGPNSTNDLERRLEVLLRNRAEDAMTRTRTQEKLDTFLDEEAVVRRTRKRITLGLVAAGAVAAALTLALWLPGLGTDKAVAPAHPTSPVQVASAFVDALADHDFAAASSYVAPGAAMWDGWTDQVGDDEMIRMEYLVTGCEQRHVTPGGTVVECRFDGHSLGSEEIGRGPFGNNYFTLTVDTDGRIVTGDLFRDFGNNGFSVQMWEPFARWVEKNHPDDFALMYDDGPYTDERVALFHQRNDEWLATQK